MTTYVLAQLSIHDPERYGRYVEAFADTLAPFAGRLLVADPRPQVLEGDWPYEKVVLIEFDDQDEADRWARSDAYVTIAADRRAATTATVLALRSVGRPTTSPATAHPPFCRSSVAPGDTDSRQNARGTPPG